MDSDEDEDCHVTDFTGDTFFKSIVNDSSPLAAAKPSHSLDVSGFDLKEQIRLDTGVRNGDQEGPAGPHDEEGVQMMCFAQRKFMGFRCKYEYDAKALLFCTQRQLCVVTYTL